MVPIGGVNLTSCVALCMTSTDAMNRSAMGSWSRHLNHDPKAIVQLYEAQALWVQGYPDQAVQRCEEEKTLSRHIGHPFNLCFSLTWGAMPYLFRKDVEAFLRTLSKRDW